MPFAKEQGRYLELMMLQVEVVYAAPKQQLLCRLNMPDGSNARQAALASKLSDKFPELNLSNCVLGIFGKRLLSAEAYLLQEGERVEIYRPLLIDPKEIRRKRAAKIAA